MKIVPAIDEPTVEEFEKSFDKVKNFAESIQIDFDDGSFENYKTIIPADMEKYVSSSKDKIFFEAHLMVQRPYDYVPKLIESGVKKIIVQYEIHDNPRDVLEQLLMDNILAGVAIGPETAVRDIEPLFDLVDTIIIMTIHPGKQGQVFLPEVLGKVKYLRENNVQQEIEIDGGVDDKTIRLVKEAGADTAVVGHHIVKADDSREQYEQLIKLIS